MSKTMQLQIAPNKRHACKERTVRLEQTICLMVATQYLAPKQPSYYGFPVDTPSYLLHNSYPHGLFRY